MSVQGLVLQKYVIHQELADLSMDVGVCLEHIFINLELIIYHFDRRRKSKWQIGGN